MTRDECRQQSRPPCALRAALRGRRRGVERPVEVGRVARARSPARSAPTLGLPDQPRGRNRARAKAYRSLEELPEPPELVVLAVPASAFEETVEGSLAAGARAIVAITAGLGESSTEGSRREQAVVERVRAAGAVLVGPNCMGLYDGRAELDLASSDFVPGDLGLISQSGNLAIEVGLLGKELGLGISRFVSIGNQADLEAAELVEELAAHEPTRVIGVYLEDFRDGRRFARAAAEAGKPVVLLAGGTSEVGAPRGPLAHGSPRQRVGRDRRRLPSRRHRSRLDSARAGRGRAAAARARSAPGTAGRDRHRRRRLGGRRGGSRERRRARAPRALGRPVGAALGCHAPDGDDEQPRRLRRRRRAGPQLVRTRAAAAARVGRGRRGAPDRLSRRVQRNLRGAPGTGDRGRTRSRARGERERPHRARPDDVLAGSAGAGAARGRRPRLPRHRRRPSLRFHWLRDGPRRPAFRSYRRPPSRGPDPATWRRAVSWPRPASTFRDPWKRRPPRKRSQPRARSATQWC